MVKILFHILNIVFLALYTFPGSILGFIFYKNLNKQPHIGTDFIVSSNFIISSNHFYAFLVLSIFGFLNYYKSHKKLIIFYFFSISIFLEFLHFIIPNRDFQIIDLLGNIAGILLSLIIINLINYKKK